ncbi:glycosyltransferase family 9 protein [Gaetbulibacter aquiaggeris]|uniref:Glycosyltransferase family 9 protein n=1 Tax=Gaetbulibacter aquiaggeris TaxID=1735373 RepID=A0ABW7MKN8_9FLAO
MPDKHAHILVIRLSAMGDVAMTVPILRALINQYPKVKLTVLTTQLFKPFFRDLVNTKVFVADVKGTHKGFFGLYKLSKELKLLHINAVADLHNVLRSNILKSFFSGYNFVQIDKGRKEKKELVSGKSFRQLKTTHERYAEVFEKLGFPLDLSSPKFPARALLNTKTESLIGEKGNNVIGIAPFAAHEGKMYPLDLMKQVVEVLSKEHQILLFGGGNKEVEALNKMAESYENVINLAGKIDLDEQIDVISNLDVMLSMDSGNAHIAAMLGVKVITLWGVTHPYAGFAPFNQPEDYMLLSDRNTFPKIPTSVFGNKFPESYKEVSRTIEPKTVINKIRSVI